MSRVSFEDLLEAGAHFGHLTRKWNPAMAPYIFMERNGIHIIDLYKTVAKLEEATEAIKKMAAQGKNILYVGTKKQAKEVIAEMAKSVQMPYVVERWPGGMLTNFPTIRKAVRKMDDIDRMSKDGTFDNLSKREKLQISRQRAKLERTLGSISGMKTLPSALLVVDVYKEHIAVKEAQRLGIPIFAVVDTNSNPQGIDYVIPANDDASDSIRVVLKALSEAINEGLMEKKVENTDEKKSEDGIPVKKERRARTGLRRERSKKRAEGDLAAPTETATAEKAEISEPAAPQTEAKPETKVKTAAEPKPAEEKSQEAKPEEEPKA